MSPFPHGGLLAQALAQEEARQRGLLGTSLGALAAPPAQQGLLSALQPSPDMAGMGAYERARMEGSVMDNRSTLQKLYDAFGRLGDPRSAETLPSAEEMAMNWWNPAMGLIGQTVFHGSPHKFTKFDASKIGTGEGAQAYGHGLYLAENPKVAKSYAGPDWRTSLKGGLDEIGNARAENALQIAKGDKASALTSLSRQLKILERSEPQGHNIAAVRSAIKQIEKGNISVLPEANIYKVDLPDEMIPKMLDWDKPLSQQPQGKIIVSLLKKHAAEKLTAEDLTSISNMESRFAYAAISDRLGGADKASAIMREAGIPGIRYLDQGSRAGGKGTYNYVVFPGEEGALKILGRE